MYITLGFQVEVSEPRSELNLNNTLQATKMSRRKFITVILGLQNRQITVSFLGKLRERLGRRLSSHEVWKSPLRILFLLSGKDT